MKSYCYSSKFTASFTKKFASTLLDTIFILLISLLLNFVSVSIFKNSSAYKYSEDNINLKVDEINSLFLKANLASFDEENNKLISGNDLFTIYLKENIALSFDIYSEELSTKEVEIDDINENLENVSLASYENDYLAYFYVNYLPSIGEPNFGKEYFINYLKSQQNSQEIYDFSKDFPNFKFDIAFNIYSYLFNEKSSEAINDYNLVKKIYGNVIGKSYEIITNLKDYKKLYSSYNDSYSYLVNIINAILCLTYLISFLIVYLVTTLFFKNGQTLGKKLNKVILISRHEDKIRNSNLIVRLILDFIGNFYLIFGSSLLISGIQTLVFGNVPLYIFIVISFIYQLLNLIFSLVRKDGCSLNDIFSKCIVINARESKN